MQRADLLRLDVAAALTPAELDDKLAETVRAVAVQRLRETVVERFDGAPPELQDAVERLRAEPTEGRPLCEEVVNELRADGIAGTLLEEAEVRVDRLAGKRADAPLTPDVPLRANPLLAEGLDSAQYGRLLTARLETAFRPTRSPNGSRRATPRGSKASWRRCSRSSTPTSVSWATRAPASTRWPRRSTSGWSAATGRCDASSTAIPGSASARSLSRCRRPSGSRAQARIGFLTRLAELNPTTELLELDLSAVGDGLDQIDFGDLSGDERSAVFSPRKGDGSC